MLIKEFGQYNIKSHERKCFLELWILLCDHSHSEKAFFPVYYISSKLPEQGEPKHENFPDASSYGRSFGGGHVP